jgi:nitrite reductase (NADH) small subunit
MSDAVLVPLGTADGRSRWTVEHEGRAYAVFCHEGSLVVTDAGCPHRGGPLGDGLIRDGAIVCPWHWYTYDLDTGRCRTTKQYRLAIYPVVTRDGAMFAEVPAHTRRSWADILRGHATRRGDRSDP